MMPSAFLLMSACLFFLCLIVIAVRFSSGMTDVVLLFVLVFGLFYGFRALLLTLGLDTPYPSDFFDLPDSPNLVAETLLWLTLFLAFFGFGVYVTSERLPMKSALVFSRNVPPTGRLTFVTFVLTAAATLISLFMIARYGGVGGFIRAVKIEKELAGLFFLKLPATIGTLCAVATFVQMRRSTSAVARRSAILVLGCAVLDGFWVFIWGQRSTLVLLGVMLLLGTLTVRQKRVSVLSALVSLLVAVAIVLSVSTGLRYARDDLVSGQVQESVGDASLARQASVATNSIYFDSSMLAFRDWPSAHPYRLGEDFELGAAGFVPRILWAGKPKTVKAGQWFRQVYQPRVVNGWPVGVPTLWWLNFGPLGICLGGLLSGLVFGALRSAQRACQPSGLNVGIALVTTVYVFQTGVGPEFPIYFASWTLPLAAVVWFVNLNPPGIGGSRRSESQAAGAPLEEARTTTAMVPRVSS